MILEWLNWSAQNENPTRTEPEILGVEMKKMNLVGQRFSRLVVIAEAGHHVKAGGQKTIQWLCKCDCGNDSIVFGSRLRKGLTKSCGCLREEKTKSGANRRTHGMNKTVEYEAWCGMIKRCTNPNYSGFQNYGGRGITVCDRWLNFENFYKDMGKKPENTTLDRIDVNGSYEPSNCRWANHTDQARNRRSNRLIESNGQTKCLTEWSEITGIERNTLWNRLNRGWNVDQALTTPPGL